MKEFKSLGFLVAWFFTVATSAQSVLEQYIAEGLQNNQQLLQETLAVTSSQLALSESKGLFLPTVNLQSDYMLADGGRTINFPIGDLLNPVYSTLNQLTNTDQFPTVENVNEQFFLNNFHDTKFRIIQPLFNSDIYYNQKAQQQLLKSSEAKRAAYEEELKKEIKVAYYNYWQAVEAIRIYESNQELLEALVDFNQKRHREDQVTLDEVYRAQFELAQLEADLSAAQAEEATAKAYFNFLLNRAHDMAIEEDPALTIGSLPTTEGTISYDDAYGRRQELNQLRFAQEAQFQAIKLAQGSRLPQLTAVLDLGYQGVDYRYNANEDYWLLNLGFSWNIFKGFRNKRQVEQARVSLDILESQEQQLRRQIALEVTRANSTFVAAKKQYRSQELAQKSADKSFDIMSSKYRESQALLVQYLDARSVALTSRLQLNLSKYRLLASKAKLDRALAY